MTISLEHSIKVQASPAKVYQALTNLDQIAQWHCGQVNGKVAIGESLTLESDEGPTFTWTTLELIPNSKIIQQCTNGPGSSTGKALTFQLQESGNNTSIELSHDSWDPADPHLSICNTHWGNVLHRLKAYIER
jgi:uncharacterized protein YndB with AHSA1/START domain